MFDWIRGSIDELRGKVREPPKSLGFILWGTWISEQNFVLIQGLFVQILSSIRETLIYWWHLRKGQMTLGFILWGPWMFIQKLVLNICSYFFGYVKIVNIFDLPMSWEEKSEDQQSRWGASSVEHEFLNMNLGLNNHYVCRYFAQ